MFFVTGAMAFLGLIFILFIVPPLFMWLIAVCMAVYHWKQQRLTRLMNDHAEAVGRSVAANLNQAKG
jgi:hypothetical protein